MQFSLIFMHSIDLNVIDWGRNNCIAAALNCEVFIWHAESGTVEQLMQTEDNDIITSVKWISEGNVLAVGLNNGTVEVCVFSINRNHYQNKYSVFKTLWGTFFKSSIIICQF